MGGRLWLQLESVGGAGGLQTAGVSPGSGGTRQRSVRSQRGGESNLVCELRLMALIVLVAILSSIFLKNPENNI